MFAETQTNQNLISELAPEFLTFARVELGFAAESIIKYKDCLKQVQKICGNLPVTEFSKADLLRLKADMIVRNLSINRQVGIILALKRFFRYLADEENLSVFDWQEIQPPRRPRKEVSYLTSEEVEQFLGSIKITNHRGGVYVAGLRFRALVEAILGSAMRITEVLSLDRDKIDFKNAEAKITGKGRKERTVFFTDRALYWIKEYLKTRTDDCPALFVCQDGKTRLSRIDIWRPFAKYRTLSGIKKKVTPHQLRHTAATQLLFNGCPVGHIKEILGHERLETTCRYYLGLDRRAAKAAHRKYLVYSPEAA
jgi:integrase/recombinase XerD